MIAMSIPNRTLFAQVQVDFDCNHASKRKKVSVNVNQRK